MHHRSLQQARHAARNQTTRLFSFDVFDTFLLRRCTAPDGVFERAFRLGPIDARFQDSVESFVQHRIQAEAKARRRQQDETGATEVTLAQIYDGFAFRLFGLDRARLGDLVAAELAAERALCVVNPEMRRLFDDLRASGIRVGFVSDTYLTGPQLADLIAACVPDLAFDFLYASCDHGTGKRDGLFARVLADQAVEPVRALHIGDNAEADIAGAKRHGLRAMHYPQATASFAGILQREGTAHGLLCAGRTSHRLDDGLATLRRLVAGRLPVPEPAFALGATILGPVMTAFDHFVAARVAQLAAAGGKVAVGFLARDGLLSYEIWQRRHPRPGHYIEINRRCALVASATSAEPLIDLFRKIHRLDRAAVADILKLDTPRLRGWFAAQPDGIATGKDFAAALPDLIAHDEIAALAADLRREMLVYLRATIAEFDDVTDLVLVDLGYSGSVQKALRQVFDAAGLATRLHGLYLLTVDEAFEDLAPNDTAQGFINDLVVTPHVNRMLMRNVALLEQLCCAATGTVRGYRDGAILREPDLRRETQIALTETVQRGALHFVAQAASAETSHGLTPFRDPATRAATAAATLGRLLVMPSESEIALLGPLEHDVNLGTSAMVAMSDPHAIDRQQVAAALPTVCAALAPPMWMGASMATLSPALGYLYALHGAGRLPGDLFADVGCGRVDIQLVGADGIRTVPASLFRTGFADLRLRIPLRRTWATQALSIPLAAIAAEGLVRGVALQTGATVAKAMSAHDIAHLPPQAVHGVDVDMLGRCYRATGDAAALVIALPALTSDVAIVSVMLTPLGERRDAATALADPDRQRDRRD